MVWTDEIERAVQEVTTALQELARHKLYRDVIPKPRPPASAEAISRYEQYLGCELSPSYRAFLSLYDGYDWLAFPGHMLSIRDVLPGGEYAPDIKEWKLGMAEVGLDEALDGIVIAYLDQPNNWVYLDPNQRAADGEMMVALHVSGADPDYYPNIVEFLRSSVERARLALSWEEKSPGEQP